MTKYELIEKISKEANLTKKDTEKVFDLTFEAIKNVAIDEGKIRINGFVTIEVVDRKERQAINPQTLELIKIPAKKIIKIKPAKQFKDLLNK